MTNCQIKGTCKLSTCFGCQNVSGRDKNMTLEEAAKLLRETYYGRWCPVSK